MTARWTAAGMPDLKNKTAVITGANSGIGYEAALAMAGKGAQIVLAVRDLKKGQAAVEMIRQQHPQAALVVMPLDLAELSSVRRFAADFQEKHTHLDMLINNAGVMAIPFAQTVNGFEMQFGVNHLGHFALTGLLLPAILHTPGARVVTVSSITHLKGKIDFDNLNGLQGYHPKNAYSQSKLANLLFAYELQRRLAAAGTPLSEAPLSEAPAISVAAHPGYSSTNLQMVGPQHTGSYLGELLWRFLNATVAQKASMGALPILYAAASPDVRGGDYIGPDGRGGIRGYPTKVRSSPQSYDEAAAKRLWDVSEEMTGVEWKW